MTLLIVFAITRVPGDERIVVEKPTVQEATAEPEALKKQDRIRQIDISRPVTDPIPVVTEHIAPDVPAKVPPVVLTSDEEDRPAAHHRRYAESESNVCTRHHMKKVVTHGGRSWRCRR